MAPLAPGLPPEGPFDAAIGCCTYHPHLAPHFVGGILSSGTEAGRRIVRERIGARAGVSPLGLGPSPAYASAQRMYGALPGAFGRQRELQCPFNADSRCTIWQHRGAPCASFHCKFERGALGAGLWNLITIAFNAVERALARWLIARTGLSAPACDALLHAPGDPALDAAAWGEWRGREEEYFLEAARLIEPLGWSEVVALARGELDGLGEALSSALARFESLPIPQQARRNPEVLVQLGASVARFRHPGASLDLLEVPTPIAARLERFQPGPLAELGLDATLLRKLLDWQVLLPL